MRRRTKSPATRTSTPWWISPLLRLPMRTLVSLLPRNPQWRPLPRGTLLRPKPRPRLSTSNPPHKLHSSRGSSPKPRNPGSNPLPSKRPHSNPLRPGTSKLRNNPPLLRPRLHLPPQPRSPQQPRSPALSLPGCNSPSSNPPAMNQGRFGALLLRRIPCLTNIKALQCGRPRCTLTGTTT